MYRPEKPAPTTIASKSVACPPSARDAVVVWFSLILEAPFQPRLVRLARL